MKDLQIYYVAYSIHGTNCFITAQLTTTGVAVEKTLEQLGPDFTVAQSRRPNAKDDNSIKLHWKKLLRSDGKPLVSRPAIINRFNILKKMGFWVDREEFLLAFKRQGNGLHQ